MTGVEYINNLGSDLKEDKSTTKAAGLNNEHTCCFYAISIDGESIAEGEGLQDRGLGLIFSDHGKKWTGSHQSGPIVALTLAMKPEGKIERAIKWCSKADKKRLETEMHTATGFIDERGDKTDKILDLWLDFCEMKGLSVEATKAGVDFTSSSFDMFNDMKKAYRKGRGLGNVTKAIIDEVEAALGHKL
jgi:hypothetical protein